MPLELDLDLQLASAATNLPSLAQFEHWVSAAINGRRARAELTVRIVDRDEATTLNRQYRGLDRPTNVLSFPFELPGGLMPDDPICDLLGDLVICAEVVEREAFEQHKASSAHWAHMVVHGVLHLLGHDHRNDAEANVMETLETRILVGLGFPPPYADQSDQEPEITHDTGSI